MFYTPFMITQTFYQNPDIDQIVLHLYLNIQYLFPIELWLVLQKSKHNDSNIARGVAPTNVAI